MQYICATRKPHINRSLGLVAKTNVCATALTHSCDPMPVQFLTSEQRANYGCYVTEPTASDLARYFHLDDSDRQRLSVKHNEHNRLGFAIQLTTVRYLGRFLDDTTQAPPNVLRMLSKQLGLADTDCLSDYHDQRQRLRHIGEICHHYGYREFNTHFVGFRLTRWLYERIPLIIPPISLTIEMV